MLEMLPNGANVRPVTPLNGHRDATERTDHPVLSLIIPTRNEADGIEPLIERIALRLTVSAEVIFVDDSDDTTPYLVSRLAERNNPAWPTIRLVHRTGRQRTGGLGSAVVEGLRRAQGTYVCVMDADLQHPPLLIEQLLAQLRDNNADLAIASRFLDANEVTGFSRIRRRASRGFAMAAHLSFPVRLRDITDPMSGFFAFRRDAVDPEILKPRGFKILLEILARQRGLRTAEVSYEFGSRKSGQSKASAREAARYLSSLTSMRVGAWLPRRRVERGSFSYDVHGIITVFSEGRLPELERFRVRELSGPPTISVRISDFDPRDPGTLVDLTSVSPSIRYDEQLGRRGFTVSIEAGEVTTASVSPLIARSPHVLYTNVVEPLLRWSLVKRGYALVHAACFNVDGSSHLVTARTDTGKTTTMLKVLEQGDYAFMSDDLTLIDKHGTVLTYPKPLTISHHTVHALTSRAELGRIERFFLPAQSRVHSKGGREFAFKLAQMGIPVATLNTIVQIICPPPKYHVGRLVPGVRCEPVGKVERLWIITRGVDGSRELEHEEALETLLENCADAYGFPPYDSLERLMLSTSDDDLRVAEAEIIRSALRDVPARELSSSHMGWAEDINRHIVASRDEGSRTGLVV